MSLESSYNTLSVKDFNAILAQAFLENYGNIVKLNLQTAEATILKTTLEPNYIYAVYPWPELIDKFVRKFVCFPDTELVLSITLERLKASIRSKTKDFPVNFRCRTGNGGFQWWELNVVGVGEADLVLISARIAESIEVFHKITALFLNQNYDYLLLIHSKKDSYIRITQNEGKNPVEEQERNRQLSEALQSAQHDAMTGIYNQKATSELIKQSLVGQYRSMAAFLFIDVDNFKMVNDTLGHQKGDELLCYLAHSLQGFAGYTGIAGRLGGDEYLLYLPDISSIPEIREIAQQLCRIFDQYSETALPANIVSCSVGISVYPYDGTDYETLLRRADQALYISKRYGKSMYFFYSSNEEEKPPSFD